jgi:predicted nucleotidyltransferase
MGLEPTPCADVNAILRRLLDDTRTILADLFVAIYVYGSLGSGDFNPHSSDIDFVIVTTDYLPLKPSPELREHRAIGVRTRGRRIIGLLM